MVQVWLRSTTGVISVVGGVSIGTGFKTLNFGMGERVMVVVVGQFKAAPGTTTLRTRIPGEVVFHLLLPAPPRPLPVREALWALRRA